MADLDRDLSTRLSRLADAVPVARGQLDPVHRSAVVARHRVRMAWITPLVFIAVAALVFVPTAPRGTDRSRSTVTEGDFALTLHAAKPTFSVEETLDVVASLTYLGPEAHVVIYHQTWGPLEFGMWAPGITLNPRGRWTCSDLEMTRGVPITEPLLDLGKNGVPFAVAHGLHEITATAQFNRGGCSAPADVLETSVIVSVADGPDDIPLLTDEASQASACLLIRNGGRLADSGTGLGVVTFDGKLREVVWPNGYSARHAADGAVLLGRNGEEIAHVGDDVEFDAHTTEGQPLRPCGDVTASRSSSPTQAPPSKEIDLATGPVPTRSDGMKVCLTALGSGILALNPRTGLGVVDESGKVNTDVVWPDGYTARYQDGVAVLIDESGHLVATVGDELSLGGGYGDDNVFHVCGAGMVGDAESPQSSLASDGGFELRLAASNATFQAGAPVEVEWSLVNAGNATSMHVLAVSPLVAFSAREVGGSRHVEADVVGSCAEFGSWSQGSPVRGYFEQSGPSSNWSDPAFVHGFGQDRDVYLPTGTWVLSAATRIFDDLCEVVISDLRAHITITILP